MSREKLYLPVITAIPTVPLHFHVFCCFVDLLMAFLCDGKVTFPSVHLDIEEGDNFNEK